MSLLNSRAARVGGVIVIVGVIAAAFVVYVGAGDREGHATRSEVAPPSPPSTMGSAPAVSDTAAKSPFPKPQTRRIELDSAIERPAPSAVDAWRHSPLGQAMITAKDSTLPVFKPTTVVLTVIQDSVHSIAESAPAGRVKKATRLGDSAIRIASDVRVRLIAEGCLVDSLDPPDQLIIPGHAARWRFTVTPQRHGDIPITAQVMDAFEGAPPYVVRVAKLTVHVSARPVAEVWQGAMVHRAELETVFGGGGVGAAVIGWLVGRRKKKNPTDRVVSRRRRAI